MQRFFYRHTQNKFSLVKKSTYLLFTALFFFSATIMAQDEGIRKIGNRIQQIKGTGAGGGDSLRHRDKLEDSITISFRYLDSARGYKLDSSITDFSRRFPVSATHIYLGNTGTASRSLLFSPNFEAGFDPGFHAFDVYKWKLEQVRFFSTTRPYSEINYLLGSRVEQIIELMHTQNIKPNWNFSFQYRLINSPGFFKNQKTNHNNYLLTSRFQSKNLRYTNYFLLLGNKMQASENGGIQDTTDFLDHPFYKDRFNIPTKLGGDDPFSSNFFSTKITTGNKYSEFTTLLRQQYDLGKKDSIVTDSTVVPLFYPRLRFEHTFQYDKDKYSFLDYMADSVYYKTYYDTSMRRPLDSFILRDKWKIIANDFSIYQFPDAKNLQQFIRLGLLIQNIWGEFSTGKTKFFNTAGHAEYRNKTRNLLWDIEANGKLYFTGLNVGDYQAHISLQRLLGKKIGYIRVGFENTSRTPSFIYDNRSSFYLLKNVERFKKENSTHLFASYFLPTFKFRLTGHYYLATNYTYINDFYQLKQQSALFNVLQIALEKTIQLGKHWNWHADIYFQQAIGDAPVNLPVIYTRNRIAYEGNLGFRNLDIAMGMEIRYRTPYKADNYSPVLGQFFPQKNSTISNPLPDISAYVHFRIRPFKAFIRAENLNTGRNLSGFGFTNNNLVAPGYAMPGLQIRVGVYWSFVN
ncbi:MAG: putative porin [Chitinophagaceae bacterium]